MGAQVLSDKGLGGNRRIYFVLSLVVLVGDQWTKWLAHAHLRGREPLEIIPGCFELIYSRNPGGLFGYFRELGDPWRLVMLTALPLCAIGFIVWMLARGQEADRPTLAALGLILGGATGNVIDRLFRGEVIDFLEVYAPPSRLADRLVDWFGTAHWPTFNVADSAIVVGACLLLVASFRPGRSVRAAGEPG